MQYMPDMEQITDTTVMEQVLECREAYDDSAYTALDVAHALQREILTPNDFASLLSPAAGDFLEQMAHRALQETRKHFGNLINLFTPLYLANHCENHCVYCGFNCYNKIRRARLSIDEIDTELRAIAQTGLREILLLTGESYAMSPVSYIAQACRIARRYFRVIGVEIYPLNVDDYAFLQ